MKTKVAIVISSDIPIPSENRMCATQNAPIASSRVIAEMVSIPYFMIFAFPPSI